MNRKLQTGLTALGGLGLVVLSAAFACGGSNGGPPACQALEACCASLGGATSSCMATATSGELSDAGCGAELANYQANGQCPGPSSSSADSGAAVDAAKD